MKYVYVLQSDQDAEYFYTGITDDLVVRLSKHNSGVVAHTAKYRPWHIKSFVAFTDDTRAFAFEKYLNSGSGRAFAKKHLWYHSAGVASHATNTRAGQLLQLPRRSPKGGDGPKSRFSSAVFFQREFPQSLLRRSLAMRPR